MTPSRKISEIEDLISQVENRDYYGETDFDRMMHLFYLDVKLMLLECGKYRGDE
tara:strand:- start:207 stop:368 length:162 start_codon:yes stop_codon:yes gene_type:complete